MRTFILALIISLVSLITGCNSIPSSNEKVHRDMEESFVCDGKDVQELEIKNGVGEITLSKAEDRDINIYVKGKVSGDDMNKCKTILENMYINAVNENGKFTVDVKCKDNKDMNFWNWIEKTINLMK